jgi:hypothetical protein
MFRVNSPVDNPCVRLLENIPIPDFLETLDHLVEEISKRVASNEERFFLGRGILSKPCKSSKHNT